jgi:hypothetical protein
MQPPPTDSQGLDAWIAAALGAIGIFFLRHISPRYIFRTVVVPEIDALLEKKLEPIQKNVASLTEDTAFNRRVLAEMPEARAAAAALREKDEGMKP